MIPLLPDLEEINLSWNDFIGGALKTVTPQFKHIQKLKVLHLGNCRLAAQDIAFLGNSHHFQKLFQQILTVGNFMDVS